MFGFFGTMFVFRSTLLDSADTLHQQPETNQSSIAKRHQGRHKSIIVGRTTRKEKQEVLFHNGLSHERDIIMAWMMVIGVNLNRIHIVIIHALQY